MTTAGLTNSETCPQSDALAAFLLRIQIPAGPGGKYTLDAKEKGHMAWILSTFFSL